MERKSQYIKTFRLEAHEHLNHIEDALLDMEQAPNDPDCVHQLFRAMHTIKGSAAMFGFDMIADLAHHAESVMEKVREGQIPISGELVDLMFAVKDHIKAMLDADEPENEHHREGCEKFIAMLQRLFPDSEEDWEQDVHNEDSNSDFLNEQKREIVLRIRFRPNRRILLSGMDPVRILDELRGLGQCEVMVNTEAVPTLAKLQAEQIYFSWDIVMITANSINEIKDCFIFVEQDSDVNIKILAESSDLEGSTRPLLGEILIDRGDATSESILKAITKQKRVGEMLVESGELSSTQVESALKEQQFFEKRKTLSQTESIRISSEKLDKLINLVGEIIVTQAHINHLAEEHENTVFASPVRQMDRLTSDLREFALDMRMLPAGTLFSKFRRLVRDLAVELGKEVELIVEGGMTELDKTILEKLHDPLVHLIRNSIDHGMRSPEERERHGKPRKGMLWLKAVHRNARVDITVADDGKGIDMASIRAKALELKLINADDDPSDAALYDILFAPGFSTASQVSGVSGRGVGLDVVKQRINSLGGSIDIKNTPGKGAAFRLSLPLTLAIIEGLHVKVNDRDFIIPVSQVETCAELKRAALPQADGQHTIRIKDELIPVIRLRDFFGLPKSQGVVEHMAAVQTGHYRIGILVDEILGNIQTVIKPLDPLYRRAQGLSGATVMGDGAVALIIDLPELIRCVKADKSKGADPLFRNKKNRHHG